MVLTAATEKSYRKHPERRRKKGRKKWQERQRLLLEQQKLLEDQAKIEKGEKPSTEEESNEDLPLSRLVSDHDVAGPSSKTQPMECTSVVPSLSVGDPGNYQAMNSGIFKESPLKDASSASSSAQIGLSFLKDAADKDITPFTGSSTVQQLWSVDKVLDSLSSNAGLLTSPAKNSSQSLTVSSNSLMLSPNQHVNSTPKEDITIVQSDQSTHVEIPLVMIKPNFESRTRQYKCILCETIVDKISQYEDHWLGHIKKDVSATQLMSETENCLPPVSGYDVAVLESGVSGSSFTVIDSQITDAKSTGLNQLSIQAEDSFDKGGCENQNNAAISVNPQAMSAGVKISGELLQKATLQSKNQEGLYNDAKQNGTIDVQKLERILNIEEIISEEVVKTDDYLSDGEDDAAMSYEEDGNIQRVARDSSSGSSSASDDEEQSEEINRLITLANDLEDRLKEDQRKGVKTENTDPTQRSVNIKDETQASRPGLPLSYSIASDKSSKDGGNVFVCNHCQKAFKNFSSLRRHHDCIHVDVKETGYDCDECGNKFSKYLHLTNHKNRIHGKYKYNGFICDECGKTFSQPAYLRNHKKITHTTVREFQCGICRSAFKSKPNLKKHMISVHTKMSESKYKCPHCWWASNKELDYKQHVAVHEGNDSPFDCPDCGKKFKTKCNYKLHMRLHDDNYNVICEFCGKRMKQSVNYRRHLVTVHKIQVPTKNFQCDRCPRAFYSQSGLDGHYRLHKQDVSLTCKECDATFTNQNLLVIHVRVEHRGISYTCEECGRLFVYEGKYKEHLEKHKKDTLTYNCDVCDQVFKNKGLMDYHMDFHTFSAKRKCKRCKLLIHKSYFQLHKNCHLSILKTIDKCCSICGFHMKTIRDLLYHCLEHAGIDAEVCEDFQEKEACDEEFIATKCQICKKEFRVLSELADHIVSHEINVENPVMCDVCTGIFVVPENYVAHLGSCFDETNREIKDENDTFDPNNIDLGPATMVAMRNIPELKEGATESNSKNSNEEVNMENDVESLENDAEGAEDGSHKEAACVLCLHVFSSAKGLRHHLLSACSGIIAIKCWNCYAKFPTNLELRKHWQSMRGQCSAVIVVEKPHPECEHCGRKFRDDACLAAHIADFHSIGAFKCSKCDEEFSLQYLLKLHEKVAHFKSNDKFCCVACDLTFDKFSSLELHMAYHQLSLQQGSEAGSKKLPKESDAQEMGAFCVHCDRMFFNEKNLNNHMAATHGIGESSIVCDICGRQFGNTTNLKVHIRTHTDEKPYKCAHCPRTFAQGGNMRRHMLTHGKKGVKSSKTLQLKKRKR